MKPNFKLTTLVDLALPSPEEQLTGKCNPISFAVLALKYSSSKTWDLTTIVDEWYLSLQSAMSSNHLGITTAPKRLEMIASASESHRAEFRKMALEEALIHKTTDSTFESQEEDFVMFRRMAAHGILQSLDNRLKPQMLKDNSYTDMQVLFLTVLGIMLITSHMLPVMEDLKVIDEVSKHFSGLPWAFSGLSLLAMLTSYCY
jgi:hypothetical protein